MNKQAVYEDNIRRSVLEMYHHMEFNLLAWMGDDTDFDEDNLTEEQIDSVLAVQAIEEEWVLDPDDRREISLISFIEDDDND